MRHNFVNAGWAAALLLGATLTTAASGQDDKPPPAPKKDTTPPRAYRMEIYEGPNRTVHYFGGAPADRSRLSDLEHTENELQYARDLEALKRQYVNSERILEPQRRYVQEQLYGTSISFGTFNYLGGFGGGGWGYGRGGFAYPYAYPYPYNYGGYGFPGFNGYLGGYSGFTTRSLAYGMGDEGKFKDAMVQVIAQQAAAPDYTLAAYRNYAAALHDAAASKELARDLNLASGEAGPARAAVALTLKGGDRVEGLKWREDGDWYVVEQPGSREVRIRKTEVTRIDLAKP
jgi:hypothetical protein